MKPFPLTCLLVASWVGGCGSGDSSPPASTVDAAPADAAADSQADTAPLDAASDAQEAGDDAGKDAEAVCGAFHPLTEWPSSGYLLAFTAAEQHAHVWVNSAEGIQHVTGWLANPVDPIGIPGGSIELDNQYNPGYSYRLVPDQVTFGDVWMELCDAAPCYIEDDPAGWLANPTSWCPWGFQLDEVYDCRTTSSGPCPVVSVGD